MAERGVGGLLETVKLVSPRVYARDLFKKRMEEKPIFPLSFVEQGAEAEMKPQDQLQLEHYKGEHNWNEALSKYMLPIAFSLRDLLGAGVVTSLGEESGVQGFYFEMNNNSQKLGPSVQLYKNTIKQYYE